MLCFSSEFVYKQQTCRGKTKGDTIPHTFGTETKVYAKEITHGYADKQVGYDGIEKHATHGLESTEGVGKDNLCAIAKLIEHKGRQEGVAECLHPEVGGEDGGDGLSEQADAAYHQKRKGGRQSPCRIGGVANLRPLSPTPELTDSDGRSCTYALLYHEYQCGDGTYHLMCRQRNVTYPSHKHAGNVERSGFKA